MDPFVHRLSVSEVFSSKSISTLQSIAGMKSFYFEAISIAMAKDYGLIPSFLVVNF